MSKATVKSMARSRAPKYDSGPFQPEAFARLIYWITEREVVRKAKEAGFTTPFTQDLILQKYRFCNVRREDDRETRWLAANWRKVGAKDPDLWFAMCVARLLNKSETLNALTQVMFRAKKVQWDPSGWCGILYELREIGPIFNGAYIVSTNGHKMDKVDYLAQKVLTPLWENREYTRPKKRDGLGVFAARLQEHDGMGSFMAAQVVADVKNTKGQELAKAGDWATWASSGPGSRRGMHRLFGRDYTAGYNERQWYADMQTLLPLVQVATGMQLHAQDVQNCLCEFDKYSRVLLGEGEPKQLYRSKA